MLEYLRPFVEIIFPSSSKVTAEFYVFKFASNQRKPRFANTKKTKGARCLSRFLCQKYRPDSWSCCISTAGFRPPQKVIFGAPYFTSCQCHQQTDQDDIAKKIVGDTMRRAWPDRMGTMRRVLFYQRRWPPLRSPHVSPRRDDDPPPLPPPPPLLAGLPVSVVIVLPPPP